MYTINIGDFEANEIIYPNRCLSASIGGGGIESDIIPGEGTSYNPWDYKYENNEFILDEIIIIVPEPEPTEQEKLRADVDYLLMVVED